MSDDPVFIAPIPPRRRFYWFTSLAHPIQAALIGLLGTTFVATTGIIGIWYSSHSKASGLESDVKSLGLTISAQNETIQAKTAEIQRLETLLTPFKTIALEKYTGSEAEALRQLGVRLQQIEDSDRLKTQKIVDLEVELQKTKELAQPNSLVLINKSIRKAEDGSFVLALHFRPNKNEQIGQVGLAAAIPLDSSSKITNIWPAGGEPFMSGDQSKKILEEGRVATLFYKPLGMNVNVEITVTAPTLIRIEGNLGVEPFEVEIQ
jgi:hypothetical protein